MTSLDVSRNNLGQLVPPSTLPAGWQGPDGGGYYEGPDGEYEKSPPGSLPLGIIALANATPDMGAITSLSLASNGLGVEGAKIIAAVLPACT